MLDKKYLLIIDAILIFGTLFSLFLVLDYRQALVIAPIDSGEHLLFTLPDVDYILVDDNSKFDSPETYFIGDNIELEEGRHFIKFFDKLSSEIREINLELDVSLKIRRLQNGSVGIFNVGDSSLQIDTYRTGNLIDTSFVNGGNNE